VAEQQFAITYKPSLVRHCATLMWVFWPVWALLPPVCFLATILAVFASPGVFPPEFTLLLLSASTLTLITGIVAKSFFADDCIDLDREHLCFPLYAAPALGMRRRLSWSELCRADLSYTGGADPDGLKLSFSSGAAIKLALKNFSRTELEQLLMVIELWGVHCAWSEPLREFQRQLQNENRGIEKVSYTKLWEDELSRRFRNTTFVPLQPGATLKSGRLVIVRQLAFGGLSAIYLARRDGSDFVVVKEANTPAEASPESRQKAGEHFQREAQLLMKLAHPQVARVLDHFVENERNYLLLEYISGQDLRQFVHLHGPLDQKSVLGFACQISSVLDYLHSRPLPVIHRDLSPDNIMLRSDGTLVLIDFGAANEFISQVTGTLVGKQAYMSPEQLRGKATPRSDYYALGATMYFLLTGEDPPAISVLHPGDKVALEPDIDGLVARLTALDPCQRVPDATEALSQLVAKQAAQIEKRDP
jgi:tRNA A-37 threonylcarbamoyl transferase component Bud32